MKIKTKYVMVVGGVIVLIIIGLIQLHLTFRSVNYPDGTEKIVAIPRGASFTKISDILYTERVIYSRFYFRIAGKILGWEGEMQSGTFVIPAGKSNYELLKDLRLGRLRQVFDLTIPEGLLNRDIAGIFARRLDLDSNKIMKLLNDSSFAAELGVMHGSLKGYLLPDRYRFFGDDSEEMVISKIVREFWKFYDDSLQKRSVEMNKTPHEVVILASIVEGETSLDGEKPRVAGLYLNRLRRNMRLQADATVQYALHDEPPRRLLYRDYRISSPYNTYLFAGLPPGPINNPGRKAILSVIFPEENDYLYMVTDGRGGHLFSRTYSEHQRAVRQYRQFRREFERAQESAAGQNNRNR